MGGEALRNVHKGTKDQAAREGLSARIRFANANRIFIFAACFRRPQYRVFRKRSCCFITAKTLFHFGSYRRFLVLPALDLSFGAGSVVFALAGTAVDFVANLFAGPILFQGFGPFVSTEISAVSIDSFFFASHKISSNGNIMHIRSGNLLPP
jgi:hypothetical protein